MPRNPIMKFAKETLPPTIEGLEQFIDLAEKEIGRISRLISAAKAMIVQKKKGMQV